MGCNIGPFSLIIEILILVKATTLNAKKEGLIELNRSNYTMYSNNLSK